MEITYGLERILTALQVWESCVTADLCMRHSCAQGSEVDCSLQGVNHFKDIQFNSQAKYGDIYMQAEYEMSCFNLDQADISVHRQLYDLYEKVSFLFSFRELQASNVKHGVASHPHDMQEAGNMLEKKLPLPAYQCLLKLSHVFNVLDARGAIGVTQRAKCFATMRRLARNVTGENSASWKPPSAVISLYVMMFNVLCRALA